ncbi:hypothetical protein ABLN87_11260 [Ruegeria sp. SCPT10]|uniref:hypothetical protein n=1 Tax=Ruegeria sp. SCP10 TaxID=3141377 RepID=UPI003339DF0E
MPSRVELLSRTFANAQRFERLCFELEGLKKPTQKMKAVEAAAHFANGTGAGVYRSEKLEAALSDLSANLERPSLSRKTRRSGVLHVMSCAFPWGGHTRVVERWMKLDGKERSQSVALTEQGLQPVPKNLREAAASVGGSIFRLPRDKPIRDRALQLRSLALEFEYVVLHIHMHDIVPSLAFGECSFPVPVIFYNHADHRFSVGFEVACAVAETRSWGQELSKLRRGILDSQRLGIPLNPDRDAVREETNAIRDRLSLPKEAKIGIASASEYKFKPFLELNLFETINKILQRNQRVWFLLVGLSKSFCHQQLQDVGGRAAEVQRVVPIPVCDETQFRSYMKAADVALDTLPENGCTTAIDYISHGLPVVSRQTFIGQMDFLVKQREYIRSDEELVDNFLSLVESEADRKSTAARQFESLSVDCGGEVFLDRLNTLYCAALTRNPIGPSRDSRFFGFSDLDLFHTDRSRHIV